MPKKPIPLKQVLLTKQKLSKIQWLDIQLPEIIQVKNYANIINFCLSEEITKKFLVETIAKLISIIPKPEHIYITHDNLIIINIFYIQLPGLDQQVNKAIKIFDDSYWQDNCNPNISIRTHLI